MSLNPFEPFDPPKLTIELVPYGQWFDNVRAKLSQGQWDRLKNACFIKAGHRCEICSGVGRKHPVECHEIWDYNDSTHTQTLLGLISLCPSCHRVKHIGNAARMGLLEPTLKHMARVNKWPLYMAEAYSEVSMDQWQWRSKFDWSIDLSWLDNAQEYLSSAEGFAREARKTLAERTLQAVSNARKQKAETQL